MPINAPEHDYEYGVKKYLRLEQWQSRDRLAPAASGAKSTPDQGAINSAYTANEC